MRKLSLFAKIFAQRNIEIKVIILSRPNSNGETAETFGFFRDIN